MKLPFFFSLQTNRTERLYSMCLSGSQVFISSGPFSTTCFLQKDSPGNTHGQDLGKGSSTNTFNWEVQAEILYIIYIHTDTRTQHKHTYNYWLFICNNIQIITSSHPKERMRRSSKDVKQMAMSTRDGRYWEGRGDSACNLPPGSRDSSNISCSSEWPVTTWGVTWGRETVKGRTHDMKC